MSETGTVTQGGPGGEMPLMEHLRELRTRVIRAVVAITIGVVVAWLLYPHFIHFLLSPYNEVKPELRDRGIDTTIYFQGLTGAFQFQLQTSLLLGLAISSPFWAWQLWAFVLPALHQHEKRAVFMLSAAVLPLFAAGAALGWYIMPKAITILLGFGGNGIGNLTDAASYLQFVTRLLLVFGIAAQVPVVVVLLNRFGVVSGAQLVHARPWIIVGLFIFAAIATPTPDPVNMLIVAIPMTVLYLISEVIVRVSDRRRGVSSAVADDDASPIDGAGAI